MLHAVAHRAIATIAALLTLINPKVHAPDEVRATFTTRHQ
jgi:hypothetical protein